MKWSHLKGQKSNSPTDCKNINYFTYAHLISSVYTAAPKIVRTPYYRLPMLLYKSTEMAVIFGDQNQQIKELICNWKTSYLVYLKLLAMLQYQSLQKVDADSANSSGRENNIKMGWNNQIYFYKYDIQHQSVFITKYLKPRETTFPPKNEVMKVLTGSSSCDFDLCVCWYFKMVQSNT